MNQIILNYLKKRFTTSSIWKLLFLHFKNNMKKIIIMLFLVTGMYSASAQKYSDQYIKEASKVANSWLNNIDDKQYQSAYLMLSNKVRTIYNQESWIRIMNELMLEFGGLASRKISEKKFQSKIEGMEDGLYVFIDYQSNYLNTINHNEHILLKQNNNAKWEIVDYNYDFRNKEK